MQDGQHVFNLR